MNKLLAYALLLLGSVNSWAQQDVRVAKFLNDCDAALSYTFDDGLQEHYTEVFPRLKRLGLKASFCIIGSKVGRTQKDTPCMTWEQLREMSADGQEITSHGYGHKSMEKLSGEALRYEVQHNDTLIYNNVGVFPRTYFFPGNRKTEEGLAFTKCDRVGVREQQVSLGSKRDSLWIAKYINRLIKNHEWGVTMTHGITMGYDAFTNPQLLWDMLERTAHMQDRLWIATLHDVAAYQAERDSVQLSVSNSNGALVVTPSLSLSKELFTMPLTLVVEGTVKEATQDKQKLRLTKKGTTTLININPHGGKIVIRV